MHESESMSGVDANATKKSNERFSGNTVPHTRAMKTMMMPPVAALPSSRQLAPR